MTEWLRGNELEKRAAGGDLGGTMRLGAYQATPDARHRKVAEIYGGTEISERHRHRYEVNMAYRERLEAKGLRFSGMSPDGVLPEIVEYDDHPWFIGVQYHPELKSPPVRAAPAVQELHRRGGGAEPAGLMAGAPGPRCDTSRRSIMSRRIDHLVIAVRDLTRPPLLRAARLPGRRPQSPPWGTENRLVQFPGVVPRTDRRVGRDGACPAP